MGADSQGAARIAELEAMNDEFERLLLRFEIAYSESEPIYHPDTERRYNEARAAVLAYVAERDKRIARLEKMLHFVMQC